MRKGKSVLGLKVISKSDAVNLGTVKDLIFDHQSDELLALLVSDKELFGLIDAQIVPWGEVITIGPDAVMVRSADSKKEAGEDARVKDVLNRQTALSGTRIMTSDGRSLGTLADTYIDEATGRVTGYEVSGGFFSDTLSGKQFLPALGSMTVGSNNVVVVPAEAAAHLEAQKSSVDTPLKKTVTTVSDKVNEAYDSAREKFSDSYANVSTATTEKQKAFVVGKTAGRDVLLPADKLPPHAAATGATGLDGREPASEISSGYGNGHTAGAAWDDKIVEDEVLVRKGEVITAIHADQADAAGILHQLLIAAGAGTASNIATSGSEKVSQLGSSIHGHTRNAVVGSRAGRQVTARDGSILVAAGEIITDAIYERAGIESREPELAASAGLAAVSHGAEAVKEQAVNLWDTIRHKAEELTGSHKAEPEQVTQVHTENAATASDNGGAIAIPPRGASTELVHSEVTHGEIVRDESSDVNIDPTARS